MNPIEYRNMRDEDLHSVLDLWMRAWEVTNREEVLHEIRTDEAYLDHTFVAVTRKGEVLSTVHYWLRRLRDGDGTPRLVGCVSHVATKEEARRQGHAGKLLEMAHTAMLRKGCEWALLFSSEMAAPLYERYGYRHFPAPYKRGLLSGQRPPTTGEYTVTRQELPLKGEALQQVSRIHEAYNRERPLILVRDAAYWEGYLAFKLEPTYFKAHQGLVLTARAAGETEDAGYIVVFITFSGSDLAQRFDLDQLFIICEIGVVPGHEAAIPRLLSAIVDATVGRRVGGRVFLPDEPEIRRSLETMLVQPVQQLDDRNMMARPLAPACTQADLEAIMSAPGAYWWWLDEF